MPITHRTWQSVVASGPCAARAVFSRMTAAPGGAASTVVRRVANIIHAYEQPGFHRTWTVVDRLSGDCLSEEVRCAGLTPTRESFSLSRIDLVTNALIAGDRRIVGVPLFDGHSPTQAFAADWVC